MKKFKLSKASMANLDGVDLRWHNILKKAITLTKVDFGIPSTGGFRTFEQQRALFDKGASECDGMRKRSRHQSGLAVDVFGWANGKISYLTEHMTAIATAIFQAAAILGHRITWGGLWTSFVDAPHFELI